MDHLRLACIILFGLPFVSFNANLNAAPADTPGTQTPEENRVSDPVLGSYLAYLHGRMAELEGNTDAAEAYYKAAIRASRNPGFIYLDLGRLYERKGDWEQAIENLQRAVSLLPDSAEAYRALGEVYEMRSLIDDKYDGINQAVTAYQNYLDRIQSPDPNVLTRVLSLLTDRGRDEEARAFAETYATKWPDSVELWSFLSNSYQTIKQMDKAEEAFKKWTELELNNPDAWESYAQFLLEQNRAEEASHALAAAIKLQPDDFNLVRNLVHIYRNRKKYDTALEFISAYEKSHPQDPQAALLAADVIADRDGPSQALNFLQKHQETYFESDPWPIKIGRLWLLYRARRYREALELANKLLVELDNTSQNIDVKVMNRYKKMILSQVGIIHFLRGEYEKAIATLKDTDVAIENPEVLDILIESQIALNQFEEAQNLINLGQSRYSTENERWIPLQIRLMESRGQIQEALKLLDSLPSEKQWREKVLFFHRQSRFQDALNLLETLRKKFPDNPDIEYFYGSSLERLGKYDQAAKVFLRLLEKKPDYAQALNYLGYMWVEHNQYVSEGTRLIQKALTLDPENPAYMDSLAWGFYRQGDYASAKKWITETLLRVDFDPLILEHAGDIYAASGDLDHAAQFWIQALSIQQPLETNPDFSPDRVFLKLREICGKNPRLNCPDLQSMQNSRQH